MKVWAQDRSVGALFAFQHIFNAEISHDGIHDCLFWAAGIDRINQHGETENIAQQCEFQPAFVTHWFGASEEIHSQILLILRNFQTFREGMKMYDGLCDHLPEAQIGRVHSSGLDGVGGPAPTAFRRQPRHREASS